MNLTKKQLILFVVAIKCHCTDTNTTSSRDNTTSWDENAPSSFPYSTSQGSDNSWIFVENEGKVSSSPGPAYNPAKINNENESSPISPIAITNFFPQSPSYSHLTGPTISESIFPMSPLCSPRVSENSEKTKSSSYSLDLNLKPISKSNSFTRSLSSPGGISSLGLPSFSDSAAQTEETRIPELEVNQSLASQINKRSQGSEEEFMDPEDVLNDTMNDGNIIDLDQDTFDSNKDTDLASKEKEIGRENTTPRNIYVVGICLAIGIFVFLVILGALLIVKKCKDSKKIKIRVISPVSKSTGNINSSEDKLTEK